MRLLLDTHIALRAIAGSARLSKAARGLIVDPHNAIFVSTASLREIAIKHAPRRKGAGAMPLSAADAFGYFSAAGYTILAITPQHTLALAALPALHADPFDRMLLAQALVEPLRLVTHDPRIAAYDARSSTRDRRAVPMPQGPARPQHQESLCRRQAAGRAPFHPCDLALPCVTTKRRCVRMHTQNRGAASL